MRILSVILKNFRNHIEEKEYTFDAGINLLLGANGSGKSSILEAIGLALFGSRIRGNIGDAVNRDKKSASITVTFLANDENSYTVTRKIVTSGGGTWRLQRTGEKGSLVEGKDLVQAKVMELVGIEKHGDLIYNSIICAVQNRFIDIFSGSKTDKDKLFNTLFDTAVYRDLFEAFNAEEGPVKRYKEEKLLLERDLEHFRGEIVDEATLTTQQETLQKEYDSAEASLTSEKTTLQILAEEIGKEEKLQSLIKENEQKKELLQKALLTQKEHYNKLTLRYEESKESAQIVKESEESYNRFQSITKEILPLEEKRKELYQKAKNLEKVRENLHQNQLTEKVLTEKITSNEKRLAEKQREFDTVLKEKGEREFQEQEIALLGKTLHAEVEELQKTFALLEEEATNYSSILKEEQELSIKIEQYKKELYSEEELDKKLSILLEEKKRYGEQKEQFNQISKEIEKKLAQHNELQEAEKKLLSGICPLLKENCENIMGNGNDNSTTSFFEERKREIIAEGKTLRQQQQSLGDVEGFGEKILKEESLLEQMQKELLKKQQLIITISEKLLEKEKKKQQRLQKLKEIAKADITDESLPSVLTEFQKRITVKETEQQNLRDQWSRIHIEVKSFTEKEKSLTDDITTIGNETTQSKNEIATFQNENQKLQSEIEEFQKEQSSITPLEKEIEELTLEKESLKEGHENYIKHSHNAKHLEQTEKECLEQQKDIGKNEEELAELALHIQELQGRFSIEKLQKLQEEALTLGQKIEGLLSQSSQVQEQLKQVLEKITQNRELQKKIGNKEKEFSIVNRKIDLTEQFRTKLKGMGKFISEEMVKRIALRATENFGAITDRGESIRWIIDETNGYMLYLATGNDHSKWREFQQLSGGEQVAVALSIRAALSDFLGNSGLAIFDEPTINLDEERRIALAESLKKILRGVEQAIIITHDGTFREIAQKTIEL